jgi:hypothetical protein
MGEDPQILRETVLSAIERELGRAPVWLSMEEKTELGKQAAKPTKPATDQAEILFLYQPQSAKAEAQSQLVEAMIGAMKLDGSRWMLLAFNSADTWERARDLSPKMIVQFGEIEALGVPFFKPHSWKTNSGIDHLQTLHPAELLGDPSLKKAVWQDLKEALAKLS